MLMQPQGPKAKMNLEQLQQGVETFERQLARAMHEGKMTKEEALALYEKFQKETEKLARKLRNEQLKRRLLDGHADRIGQEIADAVVSIKYKVWNAVFKAKYKFTNRRILEMIEQMSIQDLKKEFEKRNYLCGDEVITPIWMALRLKKPILLEGDAGVGKTEIAKVLSDILNTELIRLQCYEGLDESKALYEWNYAKQLLVLQSKRGDKENVYGDDYLMERPLLQAIRANKMPVLLIDEVDKTDEEFEAFLLEILSDFQVSIPEMGTLVAHQIPPVILTSNNMRELSDALKRRCGYLHIGYPTVDREAQILIRKAPGISPEIAHDVARAMSAVRKNLKLRKFPSISETIDVGQALVQLQAPRLDYRILDGLTTLFLKNKDDQAKYMGAGGGQWALKK